jgi:uncharacterized membrane protein YjjB (DUF3815 family)
MLIQLLAAFFATIFFSIMFNVNNKQLVYCGLVGAFGWLIYLLSIHNQISIIGASFNVSVIVSIASHILAVYRKNPVTTYQISGIIPIVPGAGMYRTLLSLIQENTEAATHYLIETLEIAGSIAVGMLFVSSLLLLISKLRHTIASYD